MTTQLLFLTAVALSMDAFAVSISCGMGLGLSRLDKVKIPFSFGLFQALMPLCGYYLASLFATYIERYDHWIAFLLLLFIGGKMIVETVRGGDEESLQGVSLGQLLLFSIATSIDALAAGIGFAVLKINILYAALFIGVTTFLLSYLGILFGRALGKRCQKYAGILGGAILVLIGVRVLLEHLMA